jgi:hypothetical protein
MFRHNRRDARTFVLFFRFSVVRRRDERVAEVRPFLERISPLNNAQKTAVPLSIARMARKTRACA